jgi:hypothetical protein
VRVPRRAIDVDGGSRLSGHSPIGLNGQEEVERTATLKPPTR